MVCEDDLASSTFSMLSVAEEEVLSASFELEEDDEDVELEEGEDSLGADKFEISSPSSAIKAIIFPTWIDDSFSSYYKGFLLVS